MLTRKGMAGMVGMGWVRTNRMAPMAPMAQLRLRITSMGMGMGSITDLHTITDMHTTTATTPTTPTTTNAEPAVSASTRLQLMWLASPALPVGGFSYSEGLEAAVEAGLVTDEAQASDWLLAQLHLVLARSDLPALMQAAKAWQHSDSVAVKQVNDWLAQTRETAEIRAQSEQMGRSLLEWLRNGTKADDPRLQQLATLKPAPLWPVAYALAATLAQASPHDAALSFAWSWAENAAQATMKTVPLGQSAAQRILSRLLTEIPAVVQSAQGLSQHPPTQWQAFTPMLAILSAQHETQYSRLFRS